MNLYNFLRATARKFTKKVKFTETVPVEPAPFIVTNHTGISAPAMFLLHYPAPLRTWSHYAFLDKKTTIFHLKNNVLKRRKAGFLLYPFARIFVSVIVWFFRQANPVPVWRGSKKIVDTLNISVETKLQGITQVVFPEKLDGNDISLVNPYLFRFNRGFVYAAKTYYEKTGKLLKFYPAYSCPSLSTVVIGEPVCYNPDYPIHEQKESVCQYLENKIHSLALTLPPHKIVLPVQK